MGWVNSSKDSLEDVECHLILDLPLIEKKILTPITILKSLGTTHRKKIVFHISQVILL